MRDYERELHSGESGEKFAAFYALLREYNEKFNLTRIVDEKDCYVKHFYDSVLGESLFPQNSVCAEIGSGGGFPSIPLMIVRKDLTFTLIESVGKKCEFLRAAAEKLSLPAKVLHVRAEDAAHEETLREKFDVCCARAVARLNTLSEYCAPFVKKGGVFLAYKANAEEEIRQARNAFRILGLQQESVLQADLPDGEGKRTIVVCRKTAQTPQKYPRGQGKERSRPL